MKQHINILLILVFIILSVEGNSQLNYKKGYIIKLNSDTLSGLINDGGGIRNSRVCIFKQDKKSEAVKYFPRDIKSYRFIGDKYYCAKELILNNDSNFVFAETLLEGKINLYFSWENKEFQFIIEKDTNVIGLINKKVVLPISPEGLYGLQNTKTFAPVYSEKSYNQTGASVYVDIYKDTLLSLFRDSEKIINRIPDLKYNEKSLAKITKAYVKETCSGNDCISYEKDFNSIRPRFGMYSGGQLRQYKRESRANSSLYYSVPVGVFGNFPMTHFNDRLSFQIELNYNGIHHNQMYLTDTIQDPNDTIQYMAIKAGTIGVPILLKYEFKGNRVKPTIAIGKEIGFVINSDVTVNLVEELMVHKTQKGGWFCEAGLNYKIAPNLSMFTNVRVQSIRNIIQAEEHQNADYSDAVRNDLYITEYKTFIAGLYVGIKF